VTPRIAESFFLRSNMNDREINKQKTIEGAPDSCENCPNWVGIKQQRLRLARLLQSASEGLEKRLENSEKPNPSVSDYLKLLQYAREIEKETEEERPREIQVTWIDPSKS
jgi:hypothetical protein